jgi:hypothetical protein
MEYRNIGILEKTLPLFPNIPLLHSSSLLDPELLPATPKRGLIDAEEVRRLLERFRRRKDSPDMFFFNLF